MDPMVALRCAPISFLASHPPSLSRPSALHDLADLLSFYAGRSIALPQHIQKCIHRRRMASKRESASLPSVVSCGSPPSPSSLPSSSIPSHPLPASVPVPPLLPPRPLLIAASSRTVDSAGVAHDSVDVCTLLPFYQHSAPPHLSLSPHRAAVADCARVEDARGWESVEARTLLLLLPTSSLHPPLPRPIILPLTR